MIKFRYTMAAVAIPAVILLGSCSTSSFMGLSRSSYVDEELTRMESEMESLIEMKAGLEEAIEAEKQLQTVLESAIAADRQLQADLDDLRKLTEDYALQLEQVPEATLRKLMTAIEAHLDTSGNIGTEIPEEDPETETAPENP